MPVAILISETTVNEPPAPTTTLTPSAPPFESLYPQVIQPTAPRIIEDDTPMYENPPSYDEAMEIINNNQKDHNSPIT